MDVGKRLSAENLGRNIEIRDKPKESCLGIKLKQVSLERNAQLCKMSLTIQIRGGLKLDHEIWQHRGQGGLDKSIVIKTLGWWWS